MCPSPTPNFKVGRATSATVATCKIVSIRSGVGLSAAALEILKQRGEGEGRDILWKEGSQIMHARLSPRTVICAGLLAVHVRFVVVHRALLR